MGNKNLDSNSIKKEVLQLYRNGLESYRMKNYSEAINRFLESIKTDDQYNNVLIMLALTYQEMLNYSEANIFFRKANKYSFKFLLNEEEKFLEQDIIEKYYAKAIEKYNDQTVTIEPWNDSVNNLRISISVLKKLDKIGRSSLYQGGKFLFELKFHYPYSIPYCYCHTKTWHPLIDPSIQPGKSNVSITILNYKESFPKQFAGEAIPTPEVVLTNIINNLKRMLQNEGYKSFIIRNCLPPKNHKILNEENIIIFRDDYLEKARKWTQKHAKE